MKKALIDTDILSYFLTGHKKVTSYFEEYLVEYETLTFSEITYFEILAGLQYKKATKQIRAFEKFVLKCTILKLTKESLKISAKVYGELRRSGIQIGTPDLLIAGLAIQNKLELITNNEKHYQSIKGLKIKNWAK